MTPRKTKTKTQSPAPELAIQPTQVQFPAQAQKRTVLQVVASVLLGIVGFIGALAIFAPQFVEAVADLLPPQWLAYATGAVGLIGAISVAVTRIMSIPGVNEWLTKVANLGAKPKA